MWISDFSWPDKLAQKLSKEFDLKYESVKTVVFPYDGKGRTIKKRRKPK